MISYTFIGCPLSWALRWQCITHQHYCVSYVAKWAQGYFQKPVSVNTLRRAICRCQLKLYHAKRKPDVNMVQKCRRALWAKTNVTWTVSKWENVQIWHSCWSSVGTASSLTVSSRLSSWFSFNCIQTYGGVEVEEALTDRSYMSAQLAVSQQWQQA